MPGHVLWSVILSVMLYLELSLAQKAMHMDKLKKKKKRYMAKGLRVFLGNILCDIWWKLGVVKN